MDAKIYIEAWPPSRRVTEGPKRAPCRSCRSAMRVAAHAAPREFRTIKLSTSPRGIVVCKAPKSAAATLAATAYQCGIEVTPFDAAKVFKRTRCIPGLKPAGRYVAKDMIEVGGIPLLMKPQL